MSTIPTISNFNIPAKTYGDASFILVDPSSDSSGAFTYGSSDLNVAIINGKIVTITGAGISTITATQDACGNYTDASINATFIVNPARPTISIKQKIPSTTVNNFTNYTDGDESYTIWYAGDDNFIIIGLNTPFIFNDVSYSNLYLSSNGVITFNNSTTSFNPLGFDFHNYAGVFFMTDMNTVSPKYIRYKNTTDTFEIIYNNVHFPYNGDIQIKITLKLQNNINSGDVIFDFGNITNDFHDTGIGYSYGTNNQNDIITNLNILSGTNYFFKPTSPIYIIPGNTQAALSNTQFVIREPFDILQSGISKTYGDASFVLIEPSSDSSGAFTYGSSNINVATISDKIVTITGAGTSFITVAQDACGNYTDSSANITLTVNKANPIFGNFAVSTTNINNVIEPPSSNSPGTFTYTSSDVNVADISGNILTIVGSGTATITATQSETANYNQGTVSVIVTISKITPVLSNFTIPRTTFEHTIIQLIPPQSTNPSGLFTYTSSNPAIADISGNLLIIVGKGTATITAIQSATSIFFSNSITAGFDTSFVNFPQPTQISPNQIIGISEPNSTIVVTEKSLTNQYIIYQIQSNAQGVWNFNVNIPSNYYSFGPLNTTRFVSSIQNNFSAKYREKSYQLTVGVPVVIKPRIYNVNSLDARWWRISAALPAGLKFSQTTGVIRGTPEVAMSPTKYRITSNSQIYLSSTMEITIEIL